MSIVRVHCSRTQRVQRVRAAGGERLGQAERDDQVLLIQQIFDLDEKEQYLQSAMWIELVRRLSPHITYRVVLFSSAQLNEFRWTLCNVPFRSCTNRSGPTTRCAGRQRITAASASCVCPPRRSGGPTSSCTTGALRCTRTRTHMISVRNPNAEHRTPNACVFAMGSADDKFDGMWAVNAVIEHTGEMQNLPPAMLRSAPLMCSYT